jgi:hypothetical protein
MTAPWTYLAVILSLTAMMSCRPEPPKEQPKLYKLYGRVVRLDPDTNLASIRHEKSTTRQLSCFPTR